MRREISTRSITAGESTPPETITTGGKARTYHGILSMIEKENVEEKGTVAQPSNHSSSPQGRASTAAALGYAWDAEAFRTDDAMKATGLTRSTTIHALDELIELGLIRELANNRADNSYRFGRPARRFEFRADAGVLVGVDAGRFSITTTVANLRGETLARSQHTLDSSDEAPTRRRFALFETITDALNTGGLSMDDVVAITVGVPAPVDSHGRSPAHATGFWEMMNPRFQDYLKEVVPIVRVENDAALAAQAEALQGPLSHCPNFVALLAGRRLGAGVMLDGRVMHGAHGGVGELEFFNYVEGLESATGFVDLVDQWIRSEIESGKIPDSHPLAYTPNKDLNAELELPHLRIDDPAMRPIVERVGALLARSCEVFSCLYDPECVVVCGRIAEALGDAIAHARALLADRAHLPMPQLIASTLGNDVISSGAVASARSAAQGGILALFTRRANGAPPAPGPTHVPASGPTHPAV